MKKIKLSKRKDAVIKQALQNLRDDIRDEYPNDIYFEGMTFDEVIGIIDITLQKDFS